MEETAKTKRPRRSRCVGVRRRSAIRVHHRIHDTKPTYKKTNVKDKSKIKETGYYTVVLMEPE